MAYWANEATPEEVGGKGAKRVVSTKPPPPKAPITYWPDIKEGKSAETGEGSEPKWE